MIKILSNKKKSGISPQSFNTEERKFRNEKNIKDRPIHFIIQKALLITGLFCLWHSYHGNSQDLTKYVDPFIGTAEHGHTYPGAIRPFGMIQLSPDVYNDTWDWVSGYHYSDSSVMGFSHTHLSGTGAGDLLDVLVTPTVGKLQLVPGTKSNPDSGYRSRFSHSQEKASPGYYSVYLKDYKILAELTTSERVGFHQYTFPETDSANIIIDLAHMSLAKKEWNCKIPESNIFILNDSMITGYRRTTRFAKNRMIYFAAIFSKPFKKSGFEKNSVLDPQIEANGTNYRAFVNFSTKEGEILKIKVAISAVSVDGALNNLKEVPNWDFNQVKNESKALWQKQLSKIEVGKGKSTDLTTFYTALYHSLVAPNLYCDRDGKYRGLDDKIHIAKGFDYYSNFSLWDTYRAAHPLYTLICPEKVDDFANSMIRMGEENPDGYFPVWPLHSGETYCMNGCHSITVICEAYLKGIRGFDIERAYSGMKKQLMKRDFFFQGDYISKKYFPYDKIFDGASRTLEHCYNDAGFSYLAKALGHKEDAAYFGNRSRNYQSLFKKEDPFIHPRDSNGNWVPKFKPD
ncbi:MAG TPA: GH92 family glycosyl hydrolase, partial [Cytophagaceae bacterium]